MSQESVSRRYARAIFEIGKEEGQLPALTRDVAALAAVFEGSLELRDVLSNPLVAEAGREAVVNEIGERLSVSGTAQKVMRLLAKNRRLTCLPEIARALARFADEQAETLRATVTSAGPLSPGYLDKLRGELEKATGKTVAILHEQDPALIAGVVTRIGDRVIDGSARARLHNFRDSALTR
jgi:F-type H+-transporting ATPase subunit delta